MPRAEDSQMPSCDYFGQMSNVQAKEHRNLMQVLPHLLNGLPVLTAAVPAGLQAAAISWVQFYRARAWRALPQWFTPADVEAMKPLAQDFAGRFGQLARQVWGSSWRGTPKYHRLLNHSTSPLLRLGLYKHYNAQHGEAAHQQDKRAYRVGSKRHASYQQEMVKRRRVNEMLAAAPDRLAKEDRSYDTAYQKTARGEGNCLCGKGLAELSNPTPEGAGDQPAVRGARQLRAAAAALVDDPHAAAALQELRPALQGHLWDVARDRRLAFVPTTPAAVTVHKSATIAATVPWELESGVVQTVHAAARFHGKPWFDWVVAEAGEALEYGRLRLLFEADVSGVPEKLMLVEWCNVVRRQDALAKAGCIRLRPAPVLRVRPERQWYGVLPLTSLVRRLYVVPDYRRPGQWHVSAFKWDRLVADKKKYDSGRRQRGGSEQGQDGNRHSRGQGSDEAGGSSMPQRKAIAADTTIGTMAADDCGESEVEDGIDLPSDSCSDSSSEEE
ncbi:hypothetical protein ABPG75_006495 [Micractinium tetrahymenae]